MWQRLLKGILCRCIPRCVATSPRCVNKGMYLCELCSKLLRRTQTVSKVVMGVWFLRQECYIASTQGAVVKVIERFWWPGVTTMTREHVQSCEHCQMHKVHPGPTRGLFHPVPPPTLPFDRVGIDHVGPFQNRTVPRSPGRPRRSRARYVSSAGARKHVSCSRACKVEQNSASTRKGVVQGHICQGI